MAEKITDYRKYLDPLSSDYIEPGINPRASYTAGYSGPVGEMRGPRSEKLYSAGTTLSKVGLPGTGEALRKVGAGLQLEPTDYTQSTLEGLSFVPGPQSVTTAARIAAPTRKLASNYASQPHPYDTAAPTELRNAYENAINQSVLSKRRIDDPNFMQRLPEEHTKDLLEYRQNADLARNLRGYRTYPTETRPSYSDYATRAQRYVELAGQRKRQQDAINEVKLNMLRGAGKGANLVRQQLWLNEFGFDPTLQQATKEGLQRVSKGQSVF